MSLSCPKCQSEMRSYERNRVLVDQCTGCGGLFLDKGELEQLATAENSWHQSQAQPAPPPQYQQHGSSQQDYQQGYQQKGGYQQQPYRKKKKSFLSELFDD